MSESKFSLTANGQPVDVDVMKDPEMVAGARAAVRVDPKDPRFVLMEQRLPAALCAFAALPIEERGASVLKASVVHNVLGVISLLVTIGETDVAQDLVAVLEERGVIEAGTVFVKTTPPPFSS